MERLHKFLSLNDKRNIIIVHTILISMLIAGILIQIAGSKPIGLANNGDFCRLTDRAGIGYIYNISAPENYGDTYFNYINTKFKFIPAVETNYFSSSHILIELSKEINAVFFDSQWYDIRALGILYLILVLAAICAIMWAVRGLEGYKRVLILAALVLFSSDVAVVQFFNSFFSEITTVAFMMICLAIAAVFIKSEKIRKSKIVKWMIYAGFVLMAALTVLAKTQDAVMVIPLFLLSLLLIKDLVPNNKVIFIIIGVLTLVGMVRPITYYNAKKTSTSGQCMYNVVFQDMLPYSPNAAETLMELGVDEKNAKYLAAKYSGTDSFVKNSGFGDPIIGVFFHNTTYKKIIVYYIKRPLEFWGMAERRSKGVFVSSVYEVKSVYDNSFNSILHGNYRKQDASYPREISHSFNYWSNFKKEYFPRNIYFITGVFLISFVMSLIAIQKSDKKYLNIHWINITIIMMAVLQFIICMIGDSHRDDVKHFFTFNYLFDLSLIFMAVYILHMVKTKKAA